MKASYYLRAQNFAAPSVNDNNVTKRSNWYGNDDDDSSRNGLVCTNNIMFDNRVCRGNTYATPVFTEDQRRHQEVYKRTQQARRSMIEKRRKDKAERPVTPPPVYGRVHAMVQTDGTSEEIFGSNDTIVIDYYEEAENCDGKLTKSLDRTISETEEMLLCSSSELGDNNNVHVVHVDRNYDDENDKNKGNGGGGIHHDENDIVDQGNDKNDVQYITSPSWIDDNDTLTNSLAKIIYDEAKNDAISRIDQGPSYHSDPER